METLREYFVKTLADLYYNYKQSYVVSDELRNEGEHELADWYRGERTKWLGQQGTLMDVAGVIGYDIGSIADDADEICNERFARLIEERKARGI